ncbi:hypothetical protein CHU98_g7896 [Xylaria longipes]|nr:hypothetical protein CHU98_g7896 [Xylaria longipes]
MILGAMGFREMGERQTRVTPAYNHTFDWIYNNPHESGKPWDNFAEWLNLLLCILELGIWGLLSAKVCFIIDGVDEYDGNHDELAQMFAQVTTSDMVKLVVSSRPIPTCVYAFSKCKNLRLQDLTIEDIRYYVHNETLPKSPSTSYRDSKDRDYRRTNRDRRYEGIRGILGLPFTGIQTYAAAELKAMLLRREVDDPADFRAMARLWTFKVTMDKDGQQMCRDEYLVAARKIVYSSWGEKVDGRPSRVHLSMRENILFTAPHNFPEA